MHPSCQRWQEARAQAIHDFIRAPDIHLLWRSIRQATDAYIAALVGIDPTIAVLAVGGYGRGELAPYSDLDLLILTHRGAAQMAPPWLYQVWDSKLGVGHQMHTVESALEAALSEHTIASNFMDARFVAGSEALAAQFRRKFMPRFTLQDKRRFIEAKLSERDSRHARFEDSRFVLEPHIKEGKGGLRDLQTLYWIARLAVGARSMRGLVKEGVLSHDSWREYQHAYMWFAMLRGLLHATRGKAEERVSFAAQASLAAALNIRGDSAEQRAEKLMLKYFAATRITGNVTRELIAGIEKSGLRPTPGGTALPQAALLDGGFVLQENRLNFSHARSLETHPEDALRIFEISHRMGRDIHPQALQMLRAALPRLSRHLPDEPAAAELFLQLLLGKNPDAILRRLNESGVLGALLPEFARVVGQMQYDGYHTFTVDEHTLVAVGNLHAIESGALREDLPTTTRVASEITNRRALYLAMLCHDLAKGMGGGHAEKGIEIAQLIARRLGLTQEEAELTGWLVSQHLLLTEIAFKRDLQDPHTIQLLVNRIQSPERLRLLLMITVADIRAVGPKIWNNWKASLLRTVYYRTLEAMGVQASVLGAVVTDHVDEALLAEYLANPALPRVRATMDAQRAITELSCVMPFQHDYLRVLAGVMAWVGASIVSAKTTLRDGVVLATIGIQDMQMQAFDEPARIAQLPELLMQAMRGELNFVRDLPRRGRVLSDEKRVRVMPEVYMDNTINPGATVLEVNAHDRTALLHDILAMLDAMKLQVVSAHIATFGQKAVDVFYVKDMYGMRIEHRSKQQQIREGLLTMLDPHRLTYYI